MFPRQKQDCSPMRRCVFFIKWLLGLKTPIAGIGFGSKRQGKKKSMDEKQLGWGVYGGDSVKRKNRVMYFLANQEQ